jgi:hypothetical protein
VVLLLSLYLICAAKWWTQFKSLVDHPQMHNERVACWEQKKCVLGFEVVWCKDKKSFMLLYCGHTLSSFRVAFLLWDRKILCICTGPETPESSSYIIVWCAKNNKSIFWIEDPVFYYLPTLPKSVSSGLFPWYPHGWCMHLLPCLSMFLADSCVI